MEKLTCAEITGYVWDQNKPNDALKVDVFIDGQIQVRLIAGDQRDDLRERGYGNGRHGFHATLPARIMDGHKHLITVVTVDTSHECSGPRSVVCPKSEHPATPAPATPAPAMPPGTPAPDAPTPTTPRPSNPDINPSVPATPVPSNAAPLAPPAS